MNYEIPNKCKTCDMPEEYRPEHPGTCGVCIQNREAVEDDPAYLDPMDAAKEVSINRFMEGW